MRSMNRFFSPAHAEIAPLLASEEPAEFRWPSARGESKPQDELNASGVEDFNFGGRLKNRLLTRRRGTRRDQTF